MVATLAGSSPSGVDSHITSLTFTSLVKTEAEIQRSLIEKVEILVVLQGAKEYAILANAPRQNFRSSGPQ